MSHIKELKIEPHFILVCEDKDLREICQLARKQSAVALDTEFVRVSTYYPKLGLIQLYDGERVALIDPIGITDFTPFIELLADVAVLKVLHSCSEDLIVFQHYFQQQPVNMVDTQIMARFIGFPQSVGLAKLLQHYFAFEMDKGATRTNWLKRPLSDKQLQYAVGDVWYLLPLYQRMQQDLEQTNWQAAVHDDCQQALLKTEKVLNRDADKAYLDIPNAWKLNPLELMRLKLLAKWRQELGIGRNLALTYVVKSEHLWKVAKFNPRNTSEMIELGLTESEVRIRGKKMLQILAQTRKVSPYDYPTRIYRITDEPLYKKAIHVLRDQLEKLIPADLQSETVASKRSLDDLIKWCWLKKEDPDKLPELLIGWRKEFGMKLLHSLRELSHLSSD